VVQFRTVGNNIYIPNDFSITDEHAAQTLIHELTHVWQYQHTGTSYISRALSAQIGAAIRSGSRNLAYAYTITADASFFDFNPEQQGHIVENYFAMLRDQTNIPGHLSAGTARWYSSNHMGPDGHNRRLNAADRLTEISAELSRHERVVRQMQASMPRSEVNLIQMRATEVMQTPGQDIFNVPEERRLTPVRPLIEVRF
jgi:hypothetical protein